VVYEINNSSHFGFAQPYKNSSQDSIIFYGCENHFGKFHCDILPNKFESVEMLGHSSRLYNVTDIPTFVQGIDNKSLEMYANNLKFITFSNSSDVSTEEFSIIFWVKGIKMPNDSVSPELGTILSQVNTEKTAGWSFDMINMNNLSKQEVRLSVYNTNGKVFDSPAIPISHNNTYTQIAGTFDGDSVKVYRDGVFFGKIKFSGAYDHDIKIPLRLGAAANDPMLFYWTGGIDNLQLYDKALPAKEIKQVYYNHKPSGKESSGNLIGYWPFDDNLHDYSGKGRNGEENTLISSMAFAPDGRLFFAEKDTGKVKVMEDENVNPNLFIAIPDHYSNWEQGLLGLAIDPEFKSNHFIYLFYTTSDNKTGEPFNRIIRFTDIDNKGSNKTIILDRIPASNGYHSGGALSFGPDGKLYATIGDATQNTKCDNLVNSTGEPCPAQDPSSLLGKVIRINRDGTIPKDNPYPNSPVYNIGHRNMYGIAFDKSGFGIVSENGESLYDEINTIEKKGNYGAPSLQPFNQDPELSTNSIKPLRSYYIAKCLTQTIYYEGNSIPQISNMFLVGSTSSSNINGYIYAIKVDSIKKQITEENVILVNNFPNDEVITIAQSPDGEIYYGGYSINKLDFINSDNKRQLLSTIEINHSSLINIKNLDFNPSQNVMTLDIKVNSNNHSVDNRLVKEFNNNNFSNSLNIKIPKQLLNNIYFLNYKTKDYTVTQDISKDIEYKIRDLQRSNQTSIDILIKENGHYLLSIFGKSSITMPQQQFSS
jgi:glucose/arabinose dehydrogenase